MANVAVRHQLDLFAGERLRIVPQHAVERAAGPHLVELRHHPLVAEQAFRRHHDQRLANLALDLPPQGVEVIRWRGAVRHLELSSRTFAGSAPAGRRNARGPGPHAVRQQAHEAQTSAAISLAGGNELVEDDLCSVVEVTVLRLPEDDCVGFGERIAVFEAEHRLLREHRVDDLIAALVGADVVERRVAVFVLLVDQDRMALREGAALAVLA